ncbi:MAG: Lrp/AsnC family transcriptional regulator [Blastocatellia bacterium]|nr:Lrp/AsnC family transcriptional regulator [Blastocatellia bacterium]
MIDDIDLNILSIIQQEARTPHTEIARQAGISPFDTAARIRRLEEEGIIRGYEARLDPQALGLGITAFVFVNTDYRVEGEDTSLLLARIPGVQEVHKVAGEDCYLVKLRAPDTERLGQLLREEFDTLEGISSTRTTIVLRAVKETSRLPLKELTAQTAGV